MSHIPVLLDAVKRAMSPIDGEEYLDGTFGAGGYASAILSHANCRLIGLDRDPSVAPFVDQVNGVFGDRFRFARAQFSDMEVVLSDLTPDGKIDGVVLDIGVSSMQLDQDARGFSFMRDGPLDMRMSCDGVSAYDAVKHLKHNELSAIFKVFGEEARAKRCADFIVRAREVSDIDTTKKLADILADALGRGGKKNPATKIFQALRIYINDELGELYRALMAAEHVLRPGGRLVVVSFHSLEDRMVKSFFRKRSGEQKSISRYAPVQASTGKEVSSATFKLLKRSGVSASDDEEAANPRARSARLRYGIRTTAEPSLVDADYLGAPAGLMALIPSLKELGGRI